MGGSTQGPPPRRMLTVTGWLLPPEFTTAKGTAQPCRTVSGIRTLIWSNPTQPGARPSNKRWPLLFADRIVVDFVIRLDNHFKAIWRGWIEIDRIRRVAAVYILASRRGCASLGKRKGHQEAGMDWGEGKILNPGVAHIPEEVLDVGQPA